MLQRPSEPLVETLDGDNFSIVRVVSDLERKLPFSLFLQFRDGAWDDVALSGTPRIYQSGLQLELNRSPERSTWANILPAHDDNAALYVVLPGGRNQIVGLLRLIRSGTQACYANVLYRRRLHRQNVSPDSVLHCLLEWFFRSGVREVTTGRIEGPRFPAHVWRCGFTEINGMWRVRAP